MPVITPTDYSVIAPQLRKLGYPVFPILPKQKIPAVKGFLSYEYDPQQSFRGAGVGVCTGQERSGAVPLVAVDIDIEDPARAETLRDVVMQRLGQTVYRVGRAPRCMLVYRAEAPGWRKVKLDGVEILGSGQFFAAYGVHPVTGTPYEWPGLLGGILDVPAAALPLVKQEDLLQLVNLLGGEVADMSKEGNAEDALENYAPPLGKTLEEMKGHLDVISPEERHIWLHCGMALHHEFGGSAEAFALWDEWSRNSAKYRDGECEKVWGEMDDSPHKKRITARWLLHTAQDVRDRQDKQNAEAEYRLIDSDIEGCADHRVLVEQIIPRVNSTGFDRATVTVLRDRIKKKFKELTGATLGASMLQSADNTDEELTEIGNYRRMVSQYGKDIMYVPQTDRWYRWDGGMWLECPRDLILRYAEATVARIPKEAEGKDDDTAELINKWYKASQRYVMQDNMVKLAQKHETVLTESKFLDSDTDYIGVLNGSIYLPSGDLITPRREQRITLNTGHEYREDADCPVFMQTVLDAFFGDEEMAGFLQRLVGYALLGTPEREEIMVIAEGHGANGKSTIFNAISHAFGKYARFCSADTFIGAQGGSGSAPREDILRLAGSRFVYVTESEDSGVLKESVVKSMTGGEAFPARGLFSRNTIEVVPTWVAFMPTNHLPIIRSEDDGIWRKIIVLPFERSFRNDPTVVMDTRRKEKTRAEAAGILRWALEGAREYAKGGLRIPKRVADKNAAYRQNSDVIGEWLECSFEAGPELFAANAEVWTSWETWSRVNGKAHLVKSSNALGRRLANRGYMPTAHPSKGRGFAGIGTKNVDSLL